MAVLYNLTTSAEQANSISEGLTRNWNDLGAIAPELPDTISPFIGSLEVGWSARLLFCARTHRCGSVASTLPIWQRCPGDGSTSPRVGLHAIHEPQRPVDAVGRVHCERFHRVSLFPPSGERVSHLILMCRYRSYRGYNYDSAYTSHSHGWSSGPTSALTFYVLGLTVTSTQGKTWSVAPHLSGLSSAEGGFQTPLGWYGVKWSVSHSSFTLTLDVPAGTSGTVSLPFAGRATINGKSTTVGSDASVDLAGGKYSIVVPR